MALESNRGLILAAVGVAALLTATLLAYRTPAALESDAPAAAFSAARAREVLKDLVGNDVPHPMGSAANAQVRDLIVRRLTALGYTATLQTGLVCNDWGVCGLPTNIVATLGPVPAGKTAVLLSAHYDSVAAGPGASDDGAGVAAVLEIARILAARPAPRNPIVLLVTDGEEAGLLGAQLFTREHDLARHVWAAVNMDSRGTSGPSLMFETGSANAWLMHLYARAVSQPITNSLSYFIYKKLPNNTDFSIFKEASYQGFNLAFIGDVARYHTPLDNWVNSTASTLQHQGNNALSAVLALGDSAEVKPPAQESVFFDVFARSVIVWPMKYTLPAALLALAVVLLEEAVLFRRGRLNRRQSVWGAVGALATVLLGGLLGTGSLALLRVFGKLPPLDALPWIAHPFAMQLVSAALAVLAACVVGAWCIRRAGFWGLWFGAALLIALLSVVAAAAVPGASFALLLAALAAALAPLPAVRAIASGRECSQGAAEFAVLVPGLVFVAVLLPVMLLLYPALGAPAWPIQTVLWCLATALFLPLLANATRRGRAVVFLAAALCVVAGITATLLLPTYSARWPQRLNIEYWVDADRGQAHWWVRPLSLRLPQAMREAASFDPVPRARIPGHPALGFFAAAPSLPLAAPELVQISSAASASAPGAPQVTHYELRLRSVRGAPEAFVVFPAAAKVREISVSGATTRRAKLHRLPGGATILLVVGIPAAGLQFGIDAAGADPTPAQVFDQSYGLPEALPAANALQRARPWNATRSQDGDVTVVQRTVLLDPAAGRE
jgi:Peptidase family M28